MAVNIDTVEAPQPIVPGPVKRFLREVGTELKKTHWPDRDELTKSTVVVIATIIAVALFLYICDNIAGFVMTHVGIGADLPK
jgi:preprotein translocase subunit SecE